ncbi:NPP1 family protein [Uliginosibacterium gangwonense]|uniref:NPP1 family protein n=1 Tax=Uliginosibacterium gangwonense TaxID=392736 RepID=UPI000382A201|nr:NPP1 family protein [Uliginosibacterium gangwonense]
MKRFIIAGAIFLANILNANAAVINHDAVVPFAQQNAVNGEQRSALTFRPYLWIQNGCAPFPSVDAAGNVGGGLKPSGGSSNGCSNSTGQVYVRSAWYRGVWAIMYSWYWPKDEPSPGIGHRHDWENVIVWINNPEASVQTVLGVSASEHSGYAKHLGAEVASSNRHPLIKYDSKWPMDHALFFTDVVGSMSQPLIHWNQLTDAARYTLNNYDYGSANVPFKDNNFWNNLAKGWYQ